MDPRGILEAVAARYAALKTLTVEVICTEEAGDQASCDEASWYRRRYQVRAWYRSPNQLRIEMGDGGNAFTFLDDGSFVQNFTTPRKLYVRYPSTHVLAFGRFEPNLGSFRAVEKGTPFLFSRIAENIVAADFLGEESGRLVIRATYLHHGTSAVFHVDPDFSLIRRLTIQAAAPVLPNRHRESLDFTSIVADLPLPDTFFEYTPPQDELPVHDVRSCQGLSEWHDARLQLLLDHAKREQIEHRLTVSEDRSTLTLKERLVSANGPVEREFTVPLKKP